MSVVHSHTFLILPVPLPSSVVTFPMDILEKGLQAKNFGMLGLGDIVIPGKWPHPLLSLESCIYSYTCRFIDSSAV